MRALGLTPSDVVARVSDRRLLTARCSGAGYTEAQLGAAYAALDKLDRDPRPGSSERLDHGRHGRAAGDRALFDLADVGGAIRGLRAARAPTRGRPTEYAVVRALSRALLDALGVGEWVDFDLSIVRGLAYYTGTVFELFDAKGELRAICGGGRYDKLLEALGGVDLPALGFGMGDVVLGELLRDRGLHAASAPALDVWVALRRGARRPRTPCAWRTALRDARPRVEYALGAAEAGAAAQDRQHARARATPVVAHRAGRWRRASDGAGPGRRASRTDVTLDAGIDSL